MSIDPLFAVKLDLNRSGDIRERVRKFSGVLIDLEVDGMLSTCIESVDNDWFWLNDVGDRRRKEAIKD